MDQFYNSFLKNEWIGIKIGLKINYYHIEYNIFNNDTGKKLREKIIIQQNIDNQH